MANISGTVQITAMTDPDMVTIYKFKEKHGTKFTFELVAGRNPNNTPGPTVINLGWSKLEGVEAVVELVKELQPKPAA
jgi:hypothetical protein